jgi:hypothetical protein
MARDAGRVPATLQIVCVVRQNKGGGLRLQENWIIQRMDWDRFEESSKTRSRVFSRTAATYHAPVLDGIDGLRTRSGRPLVVKAGPERPSICSIAPGPLNSMTNSLARPDIHLGPPPAPLAVAAE